MKHLFITSLLAILAISGNAQFLNLKGLTVQATSNLYIENDEPKSVIVAELYVMSFSDKILTHITYSEGFVSASQIYQMENDKNFWKERTAFINLMPYQVFLAIDLNMK